MGIKETLVQRPTFAFIATAIGLAQLAVRGVDIRPFISEIVDGIIPSLA